MEAYENLKLTDSGIALTTRQIAMGESKLNLANQSLPKFAKTDQFGELFHSYIVTCFALMTV